MKSKFLLLHLALDVILSEASFLFTFAAANEMNLHLVDCHTLTCCTPVGRIDNIK